MQYVARATVDEAQPGSPVVVDYDASGGHGQLDSLYDAIYGQRSTPIGLDDFSSYLAKQADKVRERTGCDKVRFTVRDDGGGPKLKAKPLR